MDFVSLLLGGFGLGAVVTAIIQHLLTARTQDKRDVRAERKEAYVGLWEAFHRQTASHYSEESYSDVGHWLFRCELVASRDVSKKLSIWSDMEPSSDERPAATETLKTAMRNDLGIAKRKL